MSDVNPERGEVPILLDGKTYPMRPSYTAMIQIEQQLGPLLALTTRLAHPLKRLEVREMAVIVTEAIRAAGEDRDDKMLQAFRVERVAELIYEQGLANAIDQLEALLVNMITGGAKAEKKTGKGETEGSTTAD